VVNALLTQIDRLKTRKNVLILTTSNMTEAIGMSRTRKRKSDRRTMNETVIVLLTILARADIAFIDRADVKFHIGLPSTKAIVILLATSLAELQSTGIVDCNVRIQ
jgi:SpoVK/Ycf46/Vps4 family AAA+-type ATPase